jgi:hypothetical protein
MSPSCLRLWGHGDASAWQGPRASSPLLSGRLALFTLLGSILDITIVWGRRELFIVVIVILSIDNPTAIILAIAIVYVVVVRISFGIIVHAIIENQDGFSVSDAQPRYRITFPDTNLCLDHRTVQHAGQRHIQ